jgi:hypothetical protein
VALEVESAVLHANAEALAMAVAVVAVAVEAVLLAVAAAVQAVAEVVPGAAQTNEAVAKAKTCVVSLLVGSPAGLRAALFARASALEDDAAMQQLSPGPHRSRTMQRPEP